MRKNEEKHLKFQSRGEEIGRSMVEILGVLAVIGVLSVGGIAGYSYAMDKHRANELLEGVSQRAVLVSAQIVANKRPSLKEFEHLNASAGGTFLNDIIDVDGGFGIKVTSVQEGVCKTLVKEAEGSDVSITKEDGEESLFDVLEEDCAPNNDLVFFFNNGLSIGSFEEEDTSDLCLDVDCGSHGTCSNGSCVCTGNYYGTNCENAPLNCINGIWDDKYHKCVCAVNYTGTTCATNLCAGYDTQCCTNGNITSTASCTTSTGGAGKCQSGQCIAETCPTGTEENGCGSGYTATLHSTLSDGTKCYTCVYGGGSRPGISHGGGSND